MKRRPVLACSLLAALIIFVGCNSKRGTPDAAPVKPVTTPLKKKDF